MRLEENATDAWEKLGEYILNNQQIIKNSPAIMENESDRSFRRVRYPIWMLSGNSIKMNQLLQSKFDLKPSFFMNIKTAAINLQYLKYYINS